MKCGASIPRGDSTRSDRKVHADLTEWTTARIRRMILDAQGFVTAGCWLARRLQQLKASTTMDLGISIFLIFVRCVALRNLELLIKTGWNVFVRFVAENAGRG